MKKHIRIFAALAMAATMLFSTAAFAEGETEAQAESTCQSYLTGLMVPTSIGRNRPIALMFNNIYDAVPQYGISNCGVLVEAEVEGLITRIMGITEDYKDAARIGSIRSARNYYYYFAREFQAIYAHFGQAAYALPLLKLDSTVELSGLDAEGETTYYRSDDRPSPHNVFTDYDRIQAGIDFKGYDRALPAAYQGHFQFASQLSPNTLENGVPANIVKPGYDYNDAEFDYNPEDGLYYRSQYGDAQVDGNTGSQLTCKNIILQYCDSTPFDDNGYLWTDVVSGGSGKFITNGKAIDITWRKPYAQEDTTFIVDINTPNITVPVYTGDFEVTHYYLSLIHI